MKAFVAYHFGTDVSQVFKLLKDNGIGFFDAMEDVIIGHSLQEAIVYSIKECDFVIIVYDQESGNLAFEAGIAVALKKPIFSIISISGQGFPDYLLDNVHVIAKPTEYDKLKFIFEIFVKNIKPVKRTFRTNEFSSSLNIQKVEITSADWKKKYNAIENKNGISLEGFIEDLLNGYKLKFSKRKRKELGYLADFSIWSDKLNTSLGNPILIEVKNNISRRRFSSIVNEINSSLEKTNAKSAIVFYDQLNNESFVFNQVRNILFIRIPDLLNKLYKKDFEDAILDCRNESLHKLL